MSKMITTEDIRKAARIIARELPATIDGRTGNSEAHQRMHELYQHSKASESFSQSAEDARATWIAEVLVKCLF